MTETMDKENLEKLLDDGRTVMLEFYASWCPHCKRMMPVVERLRESVGDRVGIYQFDIDENTAFADKLGVQSIPTFIVFSNGEEVFRHTGETTFDTLCQALESA